jgi:hypothetical protein
LGEQVLRSDWIAELTGFAGKVMRNLVNPV